MSAGDDDLVQQIGGSVVGAAVCGVGLWLIIAGGGAAGAVELGLVIGGAWLVDSSGVRSLLKTALTVRDEVDGEAGGTDDA